MSLCTVPVWANLLLGLLELPLSYLFVRWIELPTLRVRGNLIKQGSPLIRLSHWLPRGVNSVGQVALVLAMRGQG